MKIYIETKKLTFEGDNIEHELILKIKEEEFLEYDIILDLDNDILSKNEEGEYIVREQESWFNFPLFEIKNNKIIDFDYTKYSYFLNTERRMMLASKINELYNIPSEFKILRETLSYIMNEIKLTFPSDFDKMNTKINKIIEVNPKEKIK